jgi:hypothetical protein
MSQFLPTQFDRGAAAIIGEPVRTTTPLVKTSSPTVDAMVIESPDGTAIVLVNWSATPVEGLKVTLNKDANGKKAALATGGKVRHEKGGASGSTTFTLDLDKADAIILR